MSERKLLPRSAACWRCCPSASSVPAARSAECGGDVAALLPSLTSALQGQSLSIGGACFTANSSVQVTFADGPLHTMVGTATTDGTGTIVTPLSFVVPANAASGTGVGVFTGDDSVKPAVTAAIDITGCKSDSRWQQL